MVTLTPNYINERHSNATPVVATANGQLLWEIDFNTSVPPTPGREYAEGDVFCIIEASYALMNVEITKAGRLIDTCVKQGQMVKKGDMWACQFHPEKSGRIGLELLKEWMSC